MHVQAAIVQSTWSFSLSLDSEHPRNARRTISMLKVFVKINHRSKFRFSCSLVLMTESVKWCKLITKIQNVCIENSAKRDETWSRDLNLIRWKQSGITCSNASVNGASYVSSIVNQNNSPQVHHTLHIQVWWNQKYNKMERFYCANQCLETEQERCFYYDSLRRNIFCQWLWWFQYDLSLFKSHFRLDYIKLRFDLVQSRTNT